MKDCLNCGCLDDHDPSECKDDDFSSEEEELLGYECLSCGNIQERETGFGCDICDGKCLDPWYG